MCVFFITEYGELVLPGRSKRNENCKGGEGGRIGEDRENNLEAQLKSLSVERNI